MRGFKTFRSGLVIGGTLAAVACANIAAAGETVSSDEQWMRITFTDQPEGTTCVANGTRGEVTSGTSEAGEPFVRIVGNTHLGEVVCQRPDGTAVETEVWKQLRNPTQQGIDMRIDSQGQAEASFVTATSTNVVTGRLVGAYVALK